MTDRVQATLHHKTGLEETIFLEVSTDDTCSIAVPGGKTRKFEGPDLFEALCSLRLDLAKNGSVILCNGARRDVYPSGMARDMARGRKAYVLEMGKHADELVDIFETAPLELIGSVEEQENYFSTWISTEKG